MRRLVSILVSPIAAAMATAVAGVAIAAPLWYLATQHRLVYSLAVGGGMIIAAARALLPMRVRGRRGRA